MEGAFPNDPNRSIFDVNKRPKGESPPECYCGNNATCATSFEDDTFGRRYWRCQNIHELTKAQSSAVRVIIKLHCNDLLLFSFYVLCGLLQGGSRATAPNGKACHFELWIDDFISDRDQMYLAKRKEMEDDSKREARLKKELDDMKKRRGE